MAKKKGTPKTPGSGRKKGTPNRTTTSVKQALLAAFDLAGGVEAMARWGKNNPGDFYTLLAKLLPSEVKLDASITASGVCVYVPDNGRHQATTRTAAPLPDQPR